ncbi:hypothetical protein Nepgr_007735 [Nepenthes gracilis]|uniref:Uncharacterized protein n=1 Tax=Nepenthes gracilis TaxID=150966 RepID=A0AAD3XIQ8_NEPGR|nr:hypothetical protein Nepgr_007735 [Nepenthes gracilis]
MKADFTSNRKKGLEFCAANAVTNPIVARFATGAKTKHRTLAYSFSYKTVLVFVNLAVLIQFCLVRPQPVFGPFGSSVNSHVLFLAIAAISSSIA